MTFEEALELAQNGDVDAMLGLATYYFDQSSYSEAKEWYMKAAKAGHAVAMIQASCLMRMMARAKRKIGGSDCALECKEENEAALKWAQLARQNGIDDVEVKPIEAEIGICLYMEALNDDANALALLQDAERHFSNAEGSLSLEDKMYEAFTLWQERRSGKNLAGKELDRMFSRLQECSTATQDEVPNLEVVYFYLGFAYLEGIGCAKNDEKAHDAFVQAARYGMDCEDIIAKFKKKLLGGWEFTGF